ncbi:BolA protein [Inquilinus ginsengisoli]|uniref:BolA protein n=1 Tax=Inquilinus ginsengisoli TaxID=363840 RepID=A0ABU1JZC2_9PROT|nr:BolA family protein [Inquilinus ginsengisoli]MDR6293966.1 BolA protein [Inquilinus ginsengisoli]
MQIAERMRRKIEDALAPAQLEIIDDSHRHAGHAGHDGQGESHFRVRIVSEAFTGKSRVERQRLVYDLLAAELKDRVHALSLTTQTPAESAKA